jgi:hypothetical protein
MFIAGAGASGNRRLSAMRFHDSVPALVAINFQNASRNEKLTVIETTQ